MREKLKQVKPRHFAFGGMASAGSMLIYQALENPETLHRVLGEAASNQILQAGFFFTAAAFIHSKQVQREIKSNFSSLTDAINNVAISLRDDLRAQSESLKAHSVILENHSEELAKLSGQVQNVENNLNTLKEKK